MSDLVRGYEKRIEELEAFAYEKATLADELVTALKFAHVVGPLHHVGCRTCALLARHAEAKP